MRREPCYESIQLVIGNVGAPAIEPHNSVMDPSEPSLRSQVDRARFSGLPQALITTRMRGTFSASRLFSKRSILRSRVIAVGRPSHDFFPNFRTICLLVFGTGVMDVITAEGDRAI
jgi:hypothetical protein